MGTFLSPTITGCDSSLLDDCRAQLINLYDHPEQYSKKLKNSIVEAGLTGELVQPAIIRRAQNTLADALFERFLFWVLSGDTIDTKINPPEWDSS
ncbi:unnamed protein product [Rotaria socialis]|nr:unnamed protein product [Rotaria socialis]